MQQGGGHETAMRHNFPHEAFKCNQLRNLCKVSDADDCAVCPIVF